MLILVGLGMLGLGVIMMFIARPREGKAAPFLSVSIVETTYALLVTVLIGVGVMATLGGIAGLIFPGIST